MSLEENARSLITRGSISCSLVTIKRRGRSPRPHCLPSPALPGSGSRVAGAFHPASQPGCPSSPARFVLTPDYSEPRGNPLSLGGLLGPGQASLSAHLHPIRLL